MIAMHVTHAIRAEEIRYDVQVHIYSVITAPQRLNLLQSEQNPSPAGQGDIRNIQ